MPIHVHLVLVRFDADGLRRALAAVHRRYAGVIHARRRCTGHFWQGRFGQSRWTGPFGTRGPKPPIEGTAG